MVIVRTEGELHGEHQDGDEAPLELHGPWLLETDTTAGKIKTRTKNRQREVSGTRLAMSAQFLQRVYAEDLQAEEYAKTPPRSIPKPEKATTTSGVRIPPGFILCPECSTGLNDNWSCDVCEGAGIVRAPDFQEEAD